MIKEEKNQKLYLLSFSICLIASYLETTLLNNYIPIKILKYISLIPLLIKICLYDKYNKKQFLLLILLSIGIILATYFSSYKSIFICFIFIVGAKDISFKKICKYYFYINLFLMLIVLILSYIGLIENLLYYKNDIVRNSFGFSHPTEFSSHMMFMIISYLIYKNNNLKLIDYIVIIVIDLLIYKFCYTRLDCISILLILLISILDKKNKIKYNNKFIKNILIYSVVICAFISVIISYNYNPNNKYYKKLDEVLTYRLSLSKRAFNENNIKLFGQKIEEVNGLKKLQNNETNYNFIDCSYVRILLKYGLFLFSIILIYSVIFNKKMYDNNNYLILLMILIVSLASMVSHHYIDFSYNFLLLVYLSKIDLEGEV